MGFVQFVAVFKGSHRACMPQVFGSIILMALCF